MMPQIKTLYKFVEEHPEIIGGALVWTWPEERIIRVDITDEIEYEYHHSFQRLDWEYTFFGDRTDLLDFASKYDCWDGLVDESEIIDGILNASCEGYTADDNTEYVEYSELSPDVVFIPCPVKMIKRSGAYRWIRDSDKEPLSEHSKKGILSEQKGGE